jgi:hypothetical protein
MNSIASILSLICAILLNDLTSGRYVTNLAGSPSALRRFCNARRCAIGNPGM